jgi:putative FMN-dependent luciferase-like monooxygenase
MPARAIPRLGFFTRLLDDAAPAERYRIATAQIVHAERLGFDTAWVAQHHFHEAEGGLPAPFVFLAHVAARTSRIRLGTGVVTLPLEAPIRAAEDAAVFDLLADGRLELGLGTGGNPAAFKAFGLSADDRAAIYADNLALFRTALTGRPLPGGDRLYPAHPSLDGRIWQATFGQEGGRRAGLAGDGLMLSRTQPRPADRPGASLAEIQLPIVDAYLEALPAGRAPRIMASRTVFVADDRKDALHFAETGLRRFADRLAAQGRAIPARSTADLIRAQDVHLGTPEEAIESLAADATLDHVTDLVVQVHSVDPPSPFVMRSIELIAETVAPALGWARPVAADLRRVA